MTVQELIDRLKLCEPNRLVIIQKDAECNDVSPLADTWDGQYWARSSYSGDAGPDDDRDDESEDALFLVPTN